MNGPLYFSEDRPQILSGSFPIAFPNRKIFQFINANGIPDSFEMWNGGNFDANTTRSSSEL